MHIDLRTKRILAKFTREDWEALAIFAREMANNSKNIFKEGKVQEDELTKDELNVKITKLLDDLRVKTHVIGYIYFKEAVMLVYDDENYIKAVSKGLYIDIAKKYDSTEEQVRSAIDNFIKAIFKKQESEVLKRILSYYPNLREKHSNKIFISAFVEYVKLYI